VTCRLNDGAVISGEMTGVPFRGILGRAWVKFGEGGVIKSPVKDTSRILNSGFWKILAPDFRRAQRRRRKSFHPPSVLDRDGRRDGLMEPAVP
jgi:hypothetical protein